MSATAERTIDGRAARAVVSRRQQAEWSAADDRENPVAILQRQDATRVPELVPPVALAGYGRMCGWTLAHAHARSGDPSAISAYLGRRDVSDRAITDFAGRYADQVERDYRDLQKEVKGGTVEAQQ